MKILLADDDQALVTIFQLAISGAGFEVVTASDGQNALNLAATEKPDLILLDQILPDMKGNDILKSLKADPVTAAIPVVMLSNFGQNELVQEAINTGAAEYILKYQIEPQDLVEKIKQTLGQT